MNTSRKQKNDDSINVRYADILLKDECVIFNCSLCIEGSPFVLKDFPELIDHLIYDHVDVPLSATLSPNLDSQNSSDTEIGGELSGAMFITVHSQAVFRCAHCAKDFIELIPLIEHLQVSHFEASCGKTSALNYLISKDVIRDDSEGSMTDNTKSEVTTDLRPNESLSTKIASLIKIKDTDGSASIPNEAVDSNYTINKDGCFVCNFCHRRFPSKDKIGTHLFSHRAERRYSCQLCDKAFKDKFTCRQHVLRHIKEKIHRCTKCTTSFFMPSQLRRHMQRHTGERDFMCSDCGRSFFTTGALSQHMKRHQNIRPAECDICHKKFFNNHLLKHHKISHSNERSHNCSKCDATFKRRKTLLAHIKLHSNLKEYKCDICNAKFNQNPGLHSHLKTKHQILHKISPTTTCNYFSQKIKT